MTVAFVAFVLIGFCAKFASSCGAAYAERVAWGAWLVAVLWALGR